MCNLANCSSNFFISIALQKRAELQIFSFHFLCHMFYLSWCYHNCPSLHINIFTISNFTTVIIKKHSRTKVLECNIILWNWLSLWERFDILKSPEIGDLLVAVLHTCCILWTAQSVPRLLCTNNFTYSVNESYLCQNNFCNI